MGELNPFEDSSFENLDPATAFTMLKLGEAVIGEDLSEKVPRFVEKVDESMSFRKKEQRDDFQTALRVLESPVLRKLLGIFELKPFSKLSLQARRKILGKLKGSNLDTARLLYAGLANLTCSIFYGEPAAWEELRYQGPSVDDQTVLQGHRWRPDDPRPVCDEECQKAEVTC